jgi:transposase
MKSITEIIGGAQGLLDISYELQDVFEEYLSDEYKAFLHMLRVIEEAQPPITRRYAGTGRRPYEYQPFIRSALAKHYFGIEQTKQLILRLKADPNLRMLCGFKKVPGKSSFSRYFTELSASALMNETLDQMVVRAHEGTVVYHVSRDSTAIEAREKAVKKPKEKKEKKRRGRPKKGEIRPEPPELRIEKQVHESLEESIKIPAAEPQGIFKSFPSKISQTVLADFRYLSCIVVCNLFRSLASLHILLLCLHSRTSLPC